MRAWRRPTLPPLREAVPWALRVFTAEFGMGSGVWPLAMATRPATVLSCDEEVSVEAAPACPWHEQGVLPLCAAVSGAS